MLADGTVQLLFSATLTTTSQQSALGIQQLLLALGAVVSS